MSHHSGMIVGLGVELVDMRRFRAAELRYGLRLRSRLFTTGELAYAAGRRSGSQSLAVRFAAKSAARKALGLRHLSWHQVEVVRERGQAPSLRFHGAAAVQARSRGVRQVALTLTHDAQWGLGQVVLEGEARP